MILAGDIGGTKTILGLFEVSGDALRPAREAQYQSQKFRGLEEIIEQFRGGAGESIEAACFGVAGPIIDGECITTNLPWVVSARRLALLLSLPSVILLNDLESIGFGTAALNPDEWVELNKGESGRGNAGIIAAGTGLGTACLFWDGTRHIPSASEGGHIDFAPRDQLQIELLQFMLHKYERVSVERILSGPGLFHIYDFLRSSGYRREAPVVAARFQDQDPSVVISTAALAGEDELSVKALEMFVSIYGATAGDLALILKATGGLYIGGGIAPKIIDKLREGSFISAFIDKGRFTSLMTTIPVRVILNDRVALLGAARVAAGLARPIH
jgi:glucokinase